MSTNSQKRKYKRVTKPIRLVTEIHIALKIRAAQDEITMSKWIERVLRKELFGEDFSEAAQKRLFLKKKRFIPLQNKH